MLRVSLVDRNHKYRAAGENENNTYINQGYAKRQDILLNAFYGLKADHKRICTVLFKKAVYILNNIGLLPIIGLLEYWILNAYVDLKEFATD